MKKTTQKALKNLVKIGAAMDVSTLDACTYDNLRPVERLAISHGINGANGLLFRGADGKLYAVTARNSALFYFM